MGDDANGTEGSSVHRLDTRQAEMSRDLRRLFEGVLEQPIPPDLADLAARLERKLAIDNETAPGGSEQNSEPS